MTDIFDEVEEDLRHARLKKLWDEYGPYIIGGVVLALAIVAGTVGWRAMRDAAAERASVSYAAASEKIAAGNFAEAADDFAVLAKDAPAGYRVLAELQEGAVLARAGKIEEALAKLDVAANASGIYGGMARLMAAQMRADTRSAADMRTDLAPLLAEDQALKPFAQELVALAAYREGDYTSARATLRAMIENLDTPATVRDRAQALDLLIASRHGTPDPESSGAEAESQ